MDKLDLVGVLMFLLPRKQVVRMAVVYAANVIAVGRQRHLNTDAVHIGIFKSTTCPMFQCEYMKGYDPDLL